MEQTSDHQTHWTSRTLTFVTLVPKLPFLLVPIQYLQQTFTGTWQALRHLVWMLPLRMAWMVRAEVSWVMDLWLTLLELTMEVSDYQLSVGGGGHWGCTPPSPEMKPSSYSLLKFVYLTSQLHHSTPALVEVFITVFGMLIAKIFFDSTHQNCEWRLLEWLWLQLNVLWTQFSFYKVVKGGEIHKSLKYFMNHIFTDNMHYFRK